MTNSPGVATKHSKHCKEGSNSNDAKASGSVETYLILCFVCFVLIHLVHKLNGYQTVSLLSPSPKQIRDPVNGITRILTGDFLALTLQKVRFLLVPQQMGQITQATITQREKEKLLQ